MKHLTVTGPLRARPGRHRRNCQVCGRPAAAGAMAADLPLKAVRMASPRGGERAGASTFDFMVLMWPNTTDADSR